MRTITIENVNQYCRTCLVKLTNTSARQGDGDFSSLSDNEQGMSFMAVSLNENNKLRQLIRQYIGQIELNRAEYPQLICLICFNRLQNFDNFRNRSLQCSADLQILFEGGVSKLELFDNEEEKEIPCEKIPSMTDSLMETETVVITERDISELVDSEFQAPDPFSNDVMSKNANNDNNDDVINIKTGNNIIDEKDEGNKINNCTYTSMSTDDEDTPLACLRTVTRKKERDLTKLPLRPKFRRRTKKEMEIIRKEESEKDSLRDKPRKKGTKNSHRCEQCNHSFAHKLTRDAHVRKVHEGSKRPYQCDRCDKTYTFFGGLWTHIREIHEAEQRSYPCAFANCDKIYTSLIAMQKHRREKHLGMVSNKTYVCELCGTTFNQIANLKYHRRKKHPLETGDENIIKEESNERHICSICNKQFHSRYTLKYHVLQLHSSDMKFECNVCGRRMAKKFMLVQHMRIHTLDRLPCGQCEKQFIRKHELEAHVRAVHMKLKPYGCQYCPETFACRKTLRHHEYIHTGEKPYVCDVCGQAYRQQTSLKTHRKTHNTTAPDAASHDIRETEGNIR